MKRLCIGLVVALAGAGAMGETFTWTGAEDAYWTNAANWTVGGAVATRCPGVVTNEVTAFADLCTAAQGDKDTALFNGPTENATIDLDGLFAIKYVTVTNSTTPSIVFGTREGQYLPTSTGTAGTQRGIFRVCADVVNMPRCPYGIAFAVGQSHTKSTTATDKPTFEIVNDAASALHVDSYGYLVAPALSSGYYYVFCRLSGKGDFVFDGSSAGGLPTFSFFFNTTGTITFNRTPSSMAKDAVLAPTRIYLAEDVEFKFSSNAKSGFDTVSAPWTISGPGTLVTYTAGVTDRRSFIKVGSYLCQLLCNVSVTKQSSTYGTPLTGLTLAYGDADGTLVLTNGTLTSNYPFAIHCAAAVQVNRIGANGEAGPLGTKLVRLAANGALEYVGSGETTTRTFDITNVTACAAALKNSATGPWTVASEFRICGDTDATLVLDGESEVPATFASVLADRPAGEFGAGDRTFSLEKSGSTVWTVTGANTYSGSTRVKGGTLQVAQTGSIRSSSPLVFNGGTLELIGSDDPESPKSYVFDSVTVTNGASSLVVRGYANVVLNGFARGGTTGTLDIVPYAGADVRVPDLAGTTPGYVTIVGASAAFDTSGRPMNAEATVAIAARGDAVPSLAEGVVGIVRPGAGANDRLASSEVTLDTLKQFSLEDCTVDFAAGERLTAAGLEISPRAASLTLGNVAGQGTVAGADGRLVVTNGSDAALEIRAKLASGTTVVNEGPRAAGSASGDVALSGGSDGRICLANRAADLTLSGAGRFTLGPSTNGVGSSVRPSQMTIFGGADVVLDAPDGPFLVDRLSDSASVAELVLTNASFVCADPTDLAGTTESKFLNNKVMVGWNSYGRLRVQAGAVFTNQLVVGGSYGSGSGYGNHYGDGLVVVDGGEMSVVGSSDSSTLYNSKIGGRGSGSVVVNGGRFNVLGRMNVGEYENGVLLQNGGTVTVTNHPSQPPALQSLTLDGANSGRGLVAVLGGTFACGGFVNTCGRNSDVGKDNEWGTIAVDGVRTFVDCATGYVRMGDNSKDGQSGKMMCSVSGGATLRAGGFARGNSIATCPDRRVAVGFDNGVFQCSENGRDIFCRGYSSTNNLVESVRVYSGGVTIDTDGKTGNYTRQSFTGSTGGGIRSVNLPQPYSANVCPLVRVTSATGFGAVVVPVYDTDALKVTGFRVLCPGYGYEDAAFSVTSHGETLELAENENTGDFTKRGEGDFTFLAENTYGGKTILEGGTLVLGVPNALPATTVIVPRGGVLEATADNFPAVLKVDVSELDPEANAVRFARVTEGELAASPAVTIVGGEPGADWHVSSAGGIFKVGVRKGMLLIVK